MDDWMVELRRGNSDAGWDLFLDRHRRLIFAAIRHYAQDYDDVMDVFARVCESLHEGDLRRLRTYVAQTDHRASFSTWLVAVVQKPDHRLVPRAGWPTSTPPAPYRRSRGSYTPSYPPGAARGGL